MLLGLIELSIAIIALIYFNREALYEEDEENLF